MDSFWVCIGYFLSIAWLECHSVSKMEALCSLSSAAGGHWGGGQPQKTGPWRDSQMSVFRCCGGRSAGCWSFPALGQRLGFLCVCSPCAQIVFLGASLLQCLDFSCPRSLTPFLFICCRLTGLSEINACIQYARFNQKLEGI